MADYTLYNRLRSGGAVVEAALRWAGADFELVEPDSLIGTPLPESFKGTNPWGQVPTLVLPDASIMTETAAILIYLNSAFPNSDLGPPAGTLEHARFNVGSCLLPLTFMSPSFERPTRFGSRMNKAPRKV